MFDFNQPIDQLKSEIECSIKQPSNDEVYDVAVIGLGSIGSAVCYNLAKRGLKVLGIEKFGLSHEHGSHGGQTRIYRKAYFEHPDYVPLLETSYKEWEKIEIESNTQLLTRCGLAYIGPLDGELISGVEKSSDLYSIPVSRDKLQNVARYPQFKNSAI